MVLVRRLELEAEMMQAVHVRKAAWQLSPFVILSLGLAVWKPWVTAQESSMALAVDHSPHST